MSTYPYSWSKQAHQLFNDASVTEGSEAVQGVEWRGIFTLLRPAKSLQN